MKVSPGAEGPGARKGHVTGAESQQETGGDVWLRAVLGRGRGGGLRMRPTPGRYARQARCIRSSKPGLERGARVSGQSALGLGSLVSCSRVSGGPSETHVPLGRPWGCQGGGVAAGAGAGARRRPWNAAGSAPSCDAVFYSRGTGCATAAAS